MECRGERVLEKISRILDCSIDMDQAYEWALGFAVSDGYEDLKEQNPAAARAVQMLLDVEKGEKVTAREFRILEYYRQCLSGEREYVPLEEHPSLPELPDALVRHWMDTSKDHKQRIEKAMILHWLRIYVYVFAAYVFVANVWVLLQLGGPWSYKRLSAVITFPFLIYGFLLILPMKVLASGSLFLLALVLSILATGFFWFEFFQEIFSPWGHFQQAFLSLLMGAVPASAAFWLLIYEKYMKEERSL